jgi:hypothetical protein
MRLRETNVRENTIADNMGILRMQPAGVVPVGYSNYSALGMPFSGLVFGLRQYWSRA